MKLLSTFPNFSGATVEVWEWTSNFTPQLCWFWNAKPCLIKITPLFETIHQILWRHKYQKPLWSIQASSKYFDISLILALSFKQLFCQTLSKQFSCQLSHYIFTYKPSSIHFPAGRWSIEIHWGTSSLKQFISIHLFLWIKYSVRGKINVPFVDFHSSFFKQNYS